MSAPLPVNVITGPRGVGKTTLITRLLAAKPPDENWVVLLNEFTEAGIDALTVASAARGRFDVRLIAGGCLCCSGEQDFRRNLREVAAAGAADRVLVEPSGAGHPAGMIEELLAHEAQGSLRVASVLGLVDPARLASGAALRAGLTRDQLDIADTLVLAKGDLATSAAMAQLETLARSLFPPRPWIDARAAVCDGSALLDAGASVAKPKAVAMSQPAAHRHGEVSAVHPPAIVSIDGGERGVVSLLGRRAASWTFSRGKIFSRQRLLTALAGDLPGMAGAARIKGVFQVAEDAWLLLQRSEQGCTAQESSWRRDSRIEVLSESGADVDWEQWDTLWRSCVRADNPRR